MIIQASRAEAVARRQKHVTQGGTTTFVNTYMGTNSMELAAQGKSKQAPAAPGQTYPMAYLVEQAPESTVEPHYHQVDQFQLFVGGRGHIGTHPLDGVTVLVAGGAGAVGNAAIQLARWAGATVISTVSGSDKAELATAAGAHHAVNYREGDTVAAIRDLAPDGVDIVVEVAPAQNLRLDLQVIKPRGTIAIYANNGGDEITLGVRETFSTNARFQWVLLYSVGQAALRAAAEDITAAVADGAYGVGEEHGLPLHHHPLEYTADAHAAVEDGAIGKVLIDVADA